MTFSSVHESLRLSVDGNRKGTACNRAMRTRLLSCRANHKAFQQMAKAWSQFAFSLLYYKTDDGEAAANDQDFPFEPD